MDPKSTSQQEQLVKKSKALGIDLSNTQAEQLLTYLSSLLKWNKAFNLTAITDPEQALNLHLLDSVAVSPAIEPFETLIDVGTGGGLPGIPLAILHPQKAFTLLDTNSKKTRFLKQVAYELGLKNVTVINQRVEDFSHQSGYACILSRAFASLQDMVSWTEHLLEDGGRWLAMKGKYPEQEIENLPEGIVLVRSDQVEIPAIDAERYFIYLAKK